MLGHADDMTTTRQQRPGIFPLCLADVGNLVGFSSDVMESVDVGVTAFLFHPCET